MTDPYDFTCLFTKHINSQVKVRVYLVLKIYNKNHNIMIARQNQIIHNDMIQYNTQIIYSFCCLIVLLDYSSLA